MKKKVISTLLALTLAMGTLAGCAAAPATAGASADTAAADAGSSEASGDAELTLIIASNQTSAENPYHFGLAAFKETAESESGGKIAVITHDGTLGENEDELIEKLTM